MTYVGRVRVSYGNRLSRLERLRLIDAEHAQLQATLDGSEQLWEASDKSQDERRLACTTVAVALTGFAVKFGKSPYTNERLNDLLVAFGELNSGRHPVLLAPSPVHPGTFSATDLQQQAVAQVCVDFLREAGAGATEARRHVSGLFEKHQLPRFSEAKLRALNSRLKGPGSSQDEAYDTYVWARAYADHTARELNLSLRGNLSAQALKHSWPEPRSCAIAGKLARTYAMQIETMAKLKGKGSRQRITVRKFAQHEHKHIHLHQGGTENGNQPHGPRGTRATEISASSELEKRASLPGKDASRDIVSVPSCEGEEPMPAARRRDRLRGSQEFPKRSV